MTKPQITEKQLTKDILNLLKVLNHIAYQTHQPGTRAINPGLPDIAGCTPTGHAFFIEVKGPRGKVTTKQQNFLQYAKEHKAIAFVATSIEDVIKNLKLNVLL